VCAARNVHGRTLEDVERLSAEFESTPVMYTRINASTLLSGDAGDITEVDMDMDGDQGGAASRNKAKHSGEFGTGSDSDSDGGSDSNSDDGRSGSARNHVRRRNAEGDKGAGFQLSRWALGSDDEDANTGSGDAPLRKKGRKSAHPHVASLPERTLSAPKKNKKNLRVRWVDEEAEKEAAKGFCIGGSTKLRPLEEVFVLRGLGPQKDEGDTSVRPIAYHGEGRFGFIKDDHKGVAEGLLQQQK